MADDSYIPSWLTGIIDPAGGVKLYVDLTPQTYLFLILSGILIFTAGGFIWKWVAHGSK